MMKKRYILLRCIFIIINNLYSIPTYLIWMLMVRPLKLIYKPLYHWIEGTLYACLLEMVAFWIHSNNVCLHEAGDDLSSLQSSHCVVICNHQSTSDVPLLMHWMSSKSGVASQVCWIMNVMFKYTNFGWVSQVHHDFFIQEGKSTREGQIELLKTYLIDIYTRLNRKWLLLFPEGGFFYKRKEVSQRYAEKNGYPHLDHCSLPRTGALNAIINTLTCVEPRRLEWLIDLTILYPKGDALSIFDLICRRRVDPLRVVVVARKYNLKQFLCLPPEDLQAAFFQIWRQKDAMLDAYYKEGVIRVEPLRLQEDRKGLGTRVNEEDMPLSDEEEGYHGIDTEFIDSFKKSWAEVEEEEEKGGEVSTGGSAVEELTVIQMNVLRGVFLHVFFIVSLMAQYLLIQKLCAYVISLALSPF